jgi:NTP pyrophosphatase (non-canonical NTP hydrolase)
MWDQISRLYGYLGDLDEQTLILKLSEEVGEVAEAYIGTHGLNPRKGVCHTREDILAELADVIVTAAVAMCGVAGGDPEEARAHLERRLTTVTERAGV